ELGSSEKEQVQGYKVTVSVDGLAGGHSGTEIDKGRANAVKVMSRALTVLGYDVDYSLIDINGGLKDNAIPRSCDATLVIYEEERVLFDEAINKICADLKDELGTSEPGFKFTWKIEEAPAVYTAMRKLTARKILFVLELAPNGVQAMSADIPGIVESSLNLGILECKEDELRIVWSTRSSTSSYKYYLNDKLQDLIAFFGGEPSVTGDYPAWPYKRGSRLQDKAKEVYKEMYGSDPVITCVHAGLECGLLSEKMPDLDIISIGPDMPDIHTPQERMNIASADRVYDYLVKLLENMKFGES
ncbi:MAG: M20/M25/M40 family metallo-hydrolase, partial [Lachnospiraceae bacterium]|nr:M20/M25/M40 family metallo-hydrolase [Lachnospiraceae bacterium]